MPSGCASCSSWGLTFHSKPLEARPSEVIVEQHASATDSPLIDLGERGTLYMVWLSVAALRSGIFLSDFRFIPPWPDVGFQSLPPFADSRRGAAYVLPNDWEIPQEDVLDFNFGQTNWRLPCADC
jgi:hypothetical protein